MRPEQINDRRAKEGGTKAKARITVASMHGNWEKAAGLGEGGQFKVGR